MHNATKRNGGPLTAPVGDTATRRRHERFAKRLPSWRKTDCETIRQVMPKPRKWCTYMAPAHASRAKSDHTQNPINQLRRLAMDLAAEGEWDRLDLLEERIGELFSDVRPDASVAWPPIGEHLLAVYRELEETQTASISAMSDGVIRPDENAIILREATEDRAALNGLRRHLNELSDRFEKIADAAQ